MKTTFVLLAALAALTTAPVTSHASDKEVVKCHHYAARTCPSKQHRQVALFVSGRGVSQDQNTAPIQSVSHAQVGQGVSVTYYTGDR
jgi:hypothetical protein